jgi:hypothetical protein
MAAILLAAFRALCGFPALARECLRAPVVIVADVPPAKASGGANASTNAMNPGSERDLL